MKPREAICRWLGREGICRVDETPKGWFISLIMQDPLEQLSDERRIKRAKHEKVCAWSCTRQCLASMHQRWAACADKGTACLLRHTRSCVGTEQQCLAVSAGHHVSSQAVVALHNCGSSPLLKTWTRRQTRTGYKRSWRPRSSAHRPMQVDPPA